MLTSPLASRLYDEVRELPIIDYHNHLDMKVINADRPFENLTQLWLAPDPYKHRVMRMFGIPERLITGEAADYEKFEAWYGCLPRLLGHQLLTWSRMEFQKVFGFDLYPFTRPAREVWDAANEKLKTLTPKAILNLFHITYSAPCTALCDDLTVFGGAEGFAPSLRGDDLLLPTPELLRKLAALTGREINGLADYERAVALRMDAFAAVGCRYADHALDDGFTYQPDDGKNAVRFAALQQGTLAEQERPALTSYILKKLAVQYEAHGFALLLHIGARRYTSTRLRDIAGPTGGFAAIGNCVKVSSLTALLDDIEQEKALPKTVLFTLNPADNAVMAVLSGSYCKEGVEAVVSQGPAWWWCDHSQGIREMLDNFSVYGVLSTFIGMTTDSRSLLSFVRHDYFRILLCNWISEKVQAGELPEDFALLSDLAKKLCYGNALKTIEEER